MQQLRSGSAVLVLAVGLLAGCGDDVDEPSTTTAPTTTTTTTTAPTTTISLAPASGEAAVWPAPGTVIATPEEAAEDFVASALGVTPTLGPFRPGDPRSGEIEVFSPAEGGGTGVLRSVLLLRQLGPEDGWFIVGAVGDGAEITRPETGVEVAPGPVTVEGSARGFEGTVVVTAFEAGDDAAPFDDVITTGGAFADPEPFTADVDLTGATPGAVVTVLVRGGTGLETDPGDFSAVAVVIGG